MVKFFAHIWRAIFKFFKTDSTTCWEQKALYSRQLWCLLVSSGISHHLMDCGRKVADLVWGGLQIYNGRMRMWWCIGYFSVYIAHGNKQTLDVHWVDISGLGRKRMCMHTGYLLLVQWRRRFTTGRLVLCIGSFSWLGGLKLYDEIISNHSMKNVLMSL